MVEASAKAHRQKLMDSLQTQNGPATPQAPARPANNYWFLNQPAQPASVPKNMVTFNTQLVTPGMNEADVTVAAPANPTADEEQLVHQLDTQPPDMPMTAYYGHLHTIQPLSAQHQVPVANPQPALPAAGATMPSASPATPPPLPPLAPAQQAAQPPVQQVGQPAPTATAPATPAQQAAILQLANNDDLNVATLAREAHRSGPQDEVVIKLH
jgi:hypothetical protein